MLQAKQDEKERMKMRVAAAAAAGCAPGGLRWVQQQQAEGRVGEVIAV